MSKELTIHDIIRIKPPGKPDHWYVKRPIDRTYWSLDLALKTVHRFNEDKGFADSILAGNKRHVKVSKEEKAVRAERRKKHESEE